MTNDKQVIYVLHVGEHDGCEVTAILRGKAEPDIKTLERECYQEFGFTAIYEHDPASKKLIKWDERFQLAGELIAKACAVMGFDPADYSNDASPFFVSWLKARHGFVEVAEADVVVYRI